MQSQDLALEAIRRTEAYIVRERFRGYDPYDALLSPLFALPVLRSSRVLRIGATQALKRLPLNVRPLLGIRRGYNPVTLGLAIQGYAYLSVADAEHADRYRAQILVCLEELKRLRSPGQSGDCWGYDFPWESRYGTLPSFTPTIVATGVITNGLFIAYELLGIDEAFSLCASATKFVLQDLERTVEPDGSFCWGYFPSDRQQVINATMKGARLCAQVDSIEPRQDLRVAAALTAQFAASHQYENGAWPYSVSDQRVWSDNFHTGYILDCFADYARCTGDDRFDSTIQKGWRYYRDHFFEDDRVPRYFDVKTYPVDITACAQSLMTLWTFGDHVAANRVAAWVVQEMQRRDGSFIYQIRKTHRNRITYMRWGTAWMFAALGRIVYEHATAKQSVADAYGSNQ
jgi:hypothetical protein